MDDASKLLNLDALVYLDVFVTITGNRGEAWKIMPTDIARALSAKGYAVRSTTTLDSHTGLTGTYRDDRVARMLG